MERHATGRAECGATHCQDARLPVNILQRIFPSNPKG